MHRLLPLAASLALLAPVAASALDRPFAIEEGAFEGMHALDTLQTIRIGADRCYYEADPITRRLISRHPNAASAIAWGIGYGALHYAASAFIREHAPPLVFHIWEAASLFSVTRTVAGNFSIGVRIGAPNRCRYP